jgi:hypothetical protein
MPGNLSAPETPFLENSLAAPKNHASPGIISAPETPFLENSPAAPKNPASPGSLSPSDTLFLAGGPAAPEMLSAPETPFLENDPAAPENLSGPEAFFLAGGFASPGGLSPAETLFLPRGPAAPGNPSAAETLFLAKSLAAPETAASPESLSAPGRPLPAKILAPAENLPAAGYSTSPGSPGHGESLAIAESHAAQSPAGARNPAASEAAAAPGRSGLSRAFALIKVFLSKILKSPAIGGLKTALEKALKYALKSALKALAARRKTLLASLPLVAALAASISLFWIGASRRSPWPEVSELLNSVCGEGFWSAGGIAYDADNKTLAIESLALSPNGALKLPSRLSIGRLTASFEKGGPRQGYFASLVLEELSASLPAAPAQAKAPAAKAEAASPSAAYPAGSSPSAPPGAAKGAPEAASADLRLSVSSLLLSGLSVPKADGPAGPGAPLLSAKGAVTRGVALDSGDASISLESLSFPQGLSISPEGAVSAPSLSLSGLKLGGPGDRPGKAKMSLGSASYKARSGGAPSRLFLANLHLAERPPAPANSGGLGSEGEPVALSLLLGSLEVANPAPLSGSFKNPALKDLARLRGFLSRLSPSNWPLSLFAARPFSTGRMEAKELSFLIGRGPAIAADKLVSDGLGSAGFNLEGVGMAFAWPERAGGPLKGAQDGSGAAEIFRASSNTALLTESGLNPLRFAMRLDARFDPGFQRLSLTVQELKIAGGLAQAGLTAEVSSLSPAALAALGSIPLSGALGAGPVPALREAGLSHLALSFKDMGLFALLTQTEGKMLGLTPDQAATRISDALEMGLTIRLDPALSNLSEIADAVSSYLENPVFFTIKADPYPPLSLEGLSDLLPLGGEGLYRVGPTLNLSIAVNGEAPKTFDFRDQGPFDVDYTGDDSLLHPRP